MPLQKHVIGGFDHSWLGMWVSSEEDFIKKAYLTGARVNKSKAEEGFGLKGQVVQRPCCSREHYIFQELKEKPW